MVTDTSCGIVFRDSNGPDFSCGKLVAIEPFNVTNNCLSSPSMCGGSQYNIADEYGKSLLTGAEGDSTTAVEIEVYQVI